MPLPRVLGARAGSVPDNIFRASVEDSARAPVEIAPHSNKSVLGPQALDVYLCKRQDILRPLLPKAIQSRCQGRAVERNKRNWSEALCPILDSE